MKIKQMLHVSIKPETIFEIAGLPVTNSLITSSLLLILFLILGLYYNINKDSKDNSIVFFVRYIISKLHDTFKPIHGSLHEQAFPFVASFFLFILLSNWLGLLPGVGSIVVEPKDIEHVEELEHIEFVDHAEDEGEIVLEELEDEDHGIAGTVDDQDEEGKQHEAAAIPLFRGATADINMTLGLAIVSFILIQYFGIQVLGFEYVKKFINFSNPMKLFIGILELISEFSKVISFAFRLFGNIFAGEVLLTVVAFLVPILASFPFLLLEVFVGFIQALVFAMLTAVFISTAVESHEGH